jgi:hypothetical protein
VKLVRNVLPILAWVLLLAALFAQVEIQIEGPNGWAANLPTWRLDAPGFARLLFGGRAITGYHVFAFTFMFFVFHLPIALTGRFSWALEARIMGALVLFWVVEDFLWFVMNPAFGLAAFTPERIPWHPYWLLGVPADYIVFATAGIALLVFSLRTQRKSGG